MSEPAMLADHLDQQSEAILAHWRATVLHDDDVPEANRLPRSEFLDHIPALLERLAERLRGHPADAAREGQRHGGHRWRQGYDIAEVVAEFGHLRAALRRATVEFARANGWDLAPFEAALAAIDDVLDEATGESVRQFQDDSGRETQEALAEVKARQRAIEEAWVVAKVERAKLRTILRSLPVAVWVVDPDGTIIGTNEEAERMLGFDPIAGGERPNVHGLGPEYRLTRPDGTPCPTDELPILRALRGETVTHEEYDWLLRGEPRTIAVNAAPLTDAEGRVVQAVAVTVDLTARKRDEEQLRRERDVSRTVTDTVAEGLCTVDTEGRVTFANPAALAMLGWTAEALLGRNLDATVRAPADGPAAEGPLARALRTGQAVKGDEVFVRRDGSRFSAEYTASPIVSGGRTLGLVKAFHDVTERKRYEAALAEAEARFRMIAEKSPVMIWRTDASGRCDYVNQAWGEFCGPGPGHPLAEGWSGGLHDDDRDRCLEEFRRALAQRSPFELSYRIRRHDGRFRWVSDRGTPFYDPEGRFLGFLGSCLDITPRIELEDALERQRALAEEASRHKTQLVSALSHDVRTPLNAVVLSAQLLQFHLDGDHDSEVQECLRTIRHSVRNVLDLIGDLLDLSKLDAGATPPDVSRFPLDPVLAECLASIEPQARHKGLDVRFEPGALAGVSLETDRSKLKQVLSNLLSNALRYTERGHVRLLGARDAGRIQISVEDTGVGIAPANQARIFDEYAVLDDRRRRAGEGIGLGLAICRRLAGLLGGEIELTSAPGIGSTFSLVLPDSVLTSTAPSAVEVRGAAGGFDGAGAVLIVEDHADSRQTLARFLRRMGFRVLEAGNGRDALAAARQEPDLRVVLMDVNMPEMDGVEATLALRADPARRDLPIFALTGDVTVVNQNRIAEAGVNGFLEKPVTWEALRAALDSVGNRAPNGPA
jgi:PAS domain S-box-containing protein